MTIAAIILLAALVALAVRQYVREERRDAECRRHIRQRYGIGE